VTGRSPAASGRNPALSIGIFGGTFDPPHVGHLIVAQDALLALGLDRILFIPAARPPHKSDVPVTAAGVRAEMLARAIDGDERFAMDALELDRPGASYTVDTLRELAARQPATRWTLLMGADQYEEFPAWHEPDEIRRLAQLAVLMRGGTHGGAADTLAADNTGAVDPHLSRPPAHGIGGDVIALEVTRIDVSATAVRRRVAAGLPIRYLVPPAVEEFIFERKLYLRNGTPVAG
jgi:nicotinate-nucleotide adenylyltransferase